MPILGLHSGPFHGDDVFVAAVFKLLFGDMLTIIRTRDPGVLQKADILADVGGVYDPENHKFDHHQEGAPVRDNGVQYAAAGLVWKLWGRKVVQGVLTDLGLHGAHCVADHVDRDLVMPIDAGDNGQTLVKDPSLVYPKVQPYTINHVIHAMNPSWLETGDDTPQFEAAVEVMTTVLKNAICQAHGSYVAMQRFYKAHLIHDGKTIVLGSFFPAIELILDDPNYAGVLYVVYEDKQGTWMCQCVPDKPGSFGKRKALPMEWGGKRGEDLVRMTGVEDSVFCHRGVFICGAASKDGAIELARQAIEA